MNIKEIVLDYLKAHAFEGLCCEEGECGCDLEDLMECGGYEGGPWPSCKPGYKFPCPEDCGDHPYHIGEKTGITPPQVQKMCSPCVGQSKTYGY